MLNKDDFKKDAQVKAEPTSTNDNKIITYNNSDNAEYGTAIEPKPIKKREVKELPKITKDMLPTQISRWVVDISERIESPLDIGAVNALSLIGNLVGNRVGIKPKKYDYDYLEYPNLWGMVIGSPSMKKSPVFSQISKSVNRIQADEAINHKKDLEQYLSDMELYDIAKKEFLKQSKTNKDEKPKKFTMEQPKKPIRIEHFTQDATIEKIGVIIDENPKGLLILRDELSGFLKSLDSKGKEENRSFFLTGWSSGNYKIDRMGRDQIYIPKLTLGVLGNIQPSLIKQYVYDAMKGNKADGFLQRFQLLVFAEPIEVKGIDRVPNTTARDEFDNVIKYILKTEEFEGATVNEYNQESYYSYSDDAQIAYSLWYVSNDKEARQSDNEALESHLAKFPKLINSLALIFHICELSQGYQRSNFDISLNNFNMALQLTNVLKEHAKKLYSTLEVEEQQKEDMYLKIENKIIQLHNTSMLPMSFGEVSQKVAGVSAKDVEAVAKDVAIIKGKKITKLR